MAVSGGGSNEDRSIQQRPIFFFTRNICVHPLNSEPVLMTPTVANTIIQYLDINHVPACIACHIYSIYLFKIDVHTIHSLQQGDWEYTDLPAPVMGVYYAGEEVPLGILKKAAELRKRGYSMEFLIEHFRCAYPVDFTLTFLAEALHDWDQGEEHQVTYFTHGDHINTVDEIHPALRDPPPYQSPAAATDGSDTESTNSLGPSGALRSSMRPAFPLPPSRNTPRMRPSRGPADNVEPDSRGNTDVDMDNNSNMSDEEEENGGDSDSLSDSVDIDNDDQSDMNYEPSDNGDDE
jgi:hypothetical protein